MSEIETAYDGVVNLLRDCVYKLQRKTGYTDTDELMSEANWAFLQAYKKYDPKKGALTTYLWIKVTGHLLTFYGKRVQEMAREKEVSKSLPNPERFNFRNFLFELSEDAKILTTLSLEPPLSKRKSKKETIVTYLKDCGWSVFRIRRVFQEVQEALRG